MHILLGGGNLSLYHLQILSTKRFFMSRSSRDRLVVRTLRCGRNNPGSNPGHGSGWTLSRAGLFLRLQTFISRYVIYFMLIPAVNDGSKFSVFIFLSQLKIPLLVFFQLLKCKFSFFWIFRFNIFLFYYQYCMFKLIKIIIIIKLK